MNVEQVEQLIQQTPFRPYRLRLANGGEVMVVNPRKALVSGGIVAVAGIDRPRRGAGGMARLRLIRLDDIVSAEPLEDSD